MAENERDTDTGDDGAPPVGYPSAKAKVMIYVPHALHRAVKRRAVDEGRSASELFTQAAQEYLSTPVQSGKNVVTVTNYIDSKIELTLSRITDAVEIHDKLIDDISCRLVRSKKTHLMRYHHVSSAPKPQLP
ncbi:hypothetical protein [Methylorubrum populi]|uniref:CopG family transcriptional regulator n=1 Tax=Methylorubrum populi TaxID=223967 RepID=A0A833MY59_9HYPH|nr:hypothetical protein [Methylorubrum populi]KAB7783956.1 hypothetical protein F8B43_3879 [Methylorubrum populi]